MKKLLYAFPVCLFAGNVLASNGGFEDDMLRATEESKISYHQRKAHVVEEEFAQKVLNSLINLQGDVSGIVNAMQEFEEFPQYAWGRLSEILAKGSAATHDRRASELEWIQAHCKKQSLSYDVGIKLFNAVWDEALGYQAMGQMYASMARIQTVLQANKGDLDLAAQQAMEMDNGTPLRQILSKLQVIGELQQLPVLANQSVNVIDHIRGAGPQALLGKKHVDLKGLFVGANVVQEEPPLVAPVVVQKRAPLDRAIITLCKTVNGLIDEASQVRTKESVRDLGRDHVGAHYQNVNKRIESLFESLGAPKLAYETTKKDFMNLYAFLKESNHNIYKDIENIYDYSQNISYDDDATRKRLKGITSFDYLHQVFAQVARTYALLNLKSVENAQDYLGSVFLTFQTQMEETASGRKYVACQLGMTARLFQIHALTLTKLVEHYNAG